MFPILIKRIKFNYIVYLMITSMLTIVFYFNITRRGFFPMYTSHLHDVSTAQKSEKKFFEINNVENVSLNETVIFFNGNNNYLGYGNRIYAMLSAMLVALLRDSVLIVDWKPIPDLIESPFKVTFRNFTNHSYFDWTVNSTEPLVYIKTLTSNTWNSNKTLLTNTQLPEINAKRWIISDGNPYFFDLCQNSKYHEKLVDYQLVKNETVQKAIRSLDDERLGESVKLDHLLMIGFEFGGSVLNNYWRLKKPILAKIDNFYDTHMKNRYVIGLQIRNDYMIGEDLESFVDCAIKIEKNLTAQDQSTVKWFVASDRQTIIDRLESRFGDKILFGNGTIEHIGVLQDAYGRVLFDIELLSRCNETIITGGSTFGFVASMKRQKLPYFIEGHLMTKQCRRLRLSSPPKRFDNLASLL